MVINYPINKVAEMMRNINKSDDYIAYFESHHDGIHVVIESNIIQFE